MTRIFETPDAVAPRSRVDRGRVRRIEVTESRQKVGGGGAMLRGMIGGVLGNQVGHGFGQAAVTAMGAVGGAAVGNGIERRGADADTGTRYQVTVGLGQGRIRHFDYETLNGLRVGQQVQIENGVLSIF